MVLSNGEKIILNYPFRRVCYHWSGGGSFHEYHMHFCCFCSWQRTALLTLDTVWFILSEYVTLVIGARLAFLGHEVLYKSIEHEQHKQQQGKLSYIALPMGLSHVYNL